MFISRNSLTFSQSPEENTKKTIATKVSIAYNVVSGCYAGSPTLHKASRALFLNITHVVG